MARASSSCSTTPVAPSAGSCASALAGSRFAPSDVDVVELRRSSSELVGAPAARRRAARAARTARARASRPSSAAAPTGRCSSADSRASRSPPSRRRSSTASSSTSSCCTAAARCGSSARTPTQLGFRSSWASRRCRSCPHGGPAARWRRDPAASDASPLASTRTDLVFAAAGEGARGARGPRAPARLARGCRAPPPAAPGRREGARPSRARRRPTPSRTTSPSCSPTRGARESSAAPCRRTSSSRTARWPSTSRAPSALVTVSSTAVLEAIASGVPALVIDEFGVAPKLINTVFDGSGLLGGAEALVAGGRAASRARRGSTTTTSTAPRARRLARRARRTRRRRRRELAARRRERRYNLTGGALRRAFERKRMLGRARPLVRGRASAMRASPCVAARWCVVAGGRADHAALGAREVRAPQLVDAA